MQTAKVSQLYPDWESYFGHRQYLLHLSTKEQEFTTDTILFQFWLYVFFKLSDGSLSVLWLQLIQNR